MIILETERLQLREFTLDDTDEIAPHLEVISEYKHLTKREYAQGFIEHHCLALYQKDGFGLWAVIRKKTGKLIGYCGLHKMMVSGQEVVELAYRIAQDFRRQSIASEAAKTVRDYGFKKLGLLEIASCIAPENVASVGVAQNVGMTYLKDGEFRGNICKVYRIKNEQRDRNSYSD